MIGNGDLLFYSLGPAVFSFAAPLFRRVLWLENRAFVAAL